MAKESDKVERLTKYRFTGPGVYVRDDGRVIRAGEPVLALPSEIEPFKDKFKALQYVPDIGEEPEEELEAKSSLIPKHVAGGRYVVKNEDTGELVTDGYLSKVEAYEMCGMEPPPPSRSTAKGRALKGEDEEGGEGEEEE